MADLIITCYADTANSGTYPIRGSFIGKFTISTLSSTSQSVALPAGAKYVKLVTDAAATVFYAFGDGSATAATTSPELNAGQGEQIADVGVPQYFSPYIAARIA
jgi:hypothetical protein